MSVRTARCPECGSSSVYRDTYVNVNDSTDVREYDDFWCEDCEAYPQHLVYGGDQ